MKWFKHISDSLDDPDIFQVMEKFGPAGYLVFFGVLEILSREFDENSPGFCRISVKFLSKKLQLSVKKISKVLHFFAEKGRFSYVFHGDEIEISCPKLSELCDEWTQRKLGSHSGVARKILKHEVEEEVDIDNNTPLPPKEKNTPPAKKIKEEYPEDFEKFWSVYPNKKSGKSNAFISWKKLNGRRPPVEQIIAAIEKQKGSTDWIKDNGQFIPMATTWLNQKRWDAVMDVQVQPAAPKTSTLKEIRALKSIRG